ncbi:hypothetical protein SAMN04488104_105012 [Algoriphagus faecimaris]|uniref:Uncharacterized protein n=1 Tax=Algoriphagus faecimaris TaxID=686796 RepID=A0A1G6X1E4_9BACT|nr:hypothetical protein SAMN04488104_105012 [Algoriphagus faecimaris]
MSQKSQRGMTRYIGVTMRDFLGSSSGQVLTFENQL